MGLTRRLNGRDKKCIHNFGGITFWKVETWKTVHRSDKVTII